MDGTVCLSLYPKSTKFEIVSFKLGNFPFAFKLTAKPSTKLVFSGRYTVVYVDRNVAPEFSASISEDKDTRVTR